jgi:hypothetical protein
MNLIILWLVPIVYGIHIMEEAPRFVRWTKRYPWLFTSRFDTRKFIVGNILFMTYVIGSVSLALASPSPWTLILGLSTASWICANFLLHALTTLVSGIYSPGVVTAGALYVPTSLYIYGTLWQTGVLTPSLVLWSVLVGFAVMYLPFLASMIVARKDQRQSRALDEAHL